MSAGPSTSSPALRAVPEHDFEPVWGLPERLPEGERILWQGRPVWTSLARRAFLTRAVTLYFGVFMALRAIVALSDGDGALAALGAAAGLLPLWAGALAILGTMAWASAKTTAYTITNRRVVMRIGMATQATLNVPFAQVTDAAAKTYANGVGEISLKLIETARFPYFLLWPHARAARLKHPEPTLRCVPNAAAPAEILAQALAAYHADARTRAPAAAAAPTAPIEARPSPDPDHGLGGLAAAAR